MREPIPDKVAQEFLKYFLGAFSKGESLYLSVRDARQRLGEELEKDYPCASWLPVIFQHPAGVPFAWRKQQKAGVQRSPSLGCMIFLILFCFILVFLPIIPEYINIVKVNSGVGTQPEILNYHEDKSHLQEAYSTAIGLISEFPFHSVFSLPDISDKSPINGKFKLNYTSEGVVRQTTLTIQGNSGIMLTKFFNKETNKTEVVEQQAQLEKASQGLVLKSSNPIYQETRQPYPNYSSYDFIITINPNKTLKWKACNNEKKCSEVKVKQGFLTRIFGKFFERLSRSCLSLFGENK